MGIPIEDVVQHLHQFCYKHSEIEINCSILLKLRVLAALYNLHPANLINGSYHDFCIKMFHIKTFYIVQRGTYFP